MGYGITILCGKIKKIKDYKILEETQRYVFPKIGQWDLNDDSVIDICDNRGFQTKKGYGYTYWEPKDGTNEKFIHRDYYGCSRRPVLTLTVIKDLKLMYEGKDPENKYWEGERHIHNVILKLIENLKLGNKFCILVGT